MKGGARHEIGTTGITVPRLVYGTSALGNLYQELDRATKRRIVECWFEELDPPVCIDTAGKYGAGLALEEIGEGLRAIAVPADRVVISNKLGWKRTALRHEEPTFEPGVWKNLKHDAAQAISYDGILECWEQGNELLGEGFETELLSVHDPDEYLLSANSDGHRKRRFEDIVDAYTALNDLKKSGHAGAVGIGAKDWTVIRELVSKTTLDWVMLAGSLTLYTHPRELLTFVAELHEAGIFVINSALFNSGFLVGGSFFDYRPVAVETEGDLFRWRERFYAACQRYSVQPADACVEFGLAHPGVKAVALNTARPERIAENLRSVKQEAPPAFWQTLLEEGIISVMPWAL